MNAKLGGVKDRGQIPEDTVMLFESDAGWNAAGGSEIATARHMNTLLHVAFVNGLVDYVQFTNIGKLRWEPSTNSPAGLAK
jgi:ribosome biogenesis GTPase A